VYVLYAVEEANSPTSHLPLSVVHEDSRISTLSITFHRGFEARCELSLDENSS
jgi:hypothetical protein